MRTNKIIFYVCATKKLAMAKGFDALALSKTCLLLCSASYKAQNLVTAFRQLTL
jgi:hypothetical protein